jgi:hypothetical protein
MKYKRNKSCSQLGIKSFIDELTDGIVNGEIPLENLKFNVLKRLRLCINDRLYEQQYIHESEDEKNVQDHLNIIKAYYDFYIKIDQYFLLIVFLIYSGEAQLKKIRHKNFKHSVALEFKNGEILPFTDLSQDTSYLSELDFSKNLCTSYNSSILNQYLFDWELNDNIKDFLVEIDNIEKQKNKLKFKPKYSKKNSKNSRKTNKKSRKPKK